jgi:spoIIIJ-associated protein
MNPYERRIIHSALQGDKFVETYSEGEEPYRRVVINIKKTNRDTKYSSNYRKNYSKKNYNKNYSYDYKKDYLEYKESKEKENQEK